MKKAVIILSIISFMIGQTNPIDIATTGATRYSITARDVNGSRAKVFA